MTSLDYLFANYADNHRHPTNQVIHWVCVPAILWAAVALIWLIPVPRQWLHQGAWAVLALFLVYLYYQKLSPRLSRAMAVFFIILAVLTYGLYTWLGPYSLRRIAIVVLIAGWIGQFAGHRIEKSRPSFFTNLIHLLIGPLWLMNELLEKIRLPH